MTPIVYIVTYCRKIELLYGSVLTFKTLRTGFPTARVIVVDNGSIPEARPAIEAAALGCGAEYHQRAEACAHADILAEVAMNGRTSPIVFVDPDVVFWSGCEQWNFGDAIIAGRRIPTFYDTYTRCATVSRLHTSFLWISNPRELQGTVTDVRQLYPEFIPFRPVMMKAADGWIHWDTFAGITSTLGKYAQAFGAFQLDSYDHLFCGSHIDLVASSLPSSIRDEWTKLHTAVKRGNLEAARGWWRKQDEFFSAQGAA